MGAFFVSGELGVKSKEKRVLKRANACTLTLCSLFELVLLFDAK